MVLYDMPQNFQDAVIATRALGISYFWIDSSCIIQDSEADKKREIPQMVNIYSSSRFTVCVTSAQNSRSGFLAQEPLPQPSVVMPFVPSNGELVGTYNIYTLNSPGFSHDKTWDTDVDSSEWNQRGWTFQERLISPRIIHFAKDKLYFECTTGDKSEEGDLSRPAILSRLSRYMGMEGFRFLGPYQHFARQNPLNFQAVTQAYYDLATQYSNRSLSFQHDKAAAFSAIVSQFQTVLKA